MTWTQHERKLISSSELFFCNSEAETQLTYFGSKNILGWLVYGYTKTKNKQYISYQYVLFRSKIIIKKLHVIGYTFFQ